jgi:inner membrane protein
MDSVTHIALGACMGEAFAGKTVGKKAMLWGAMAQTMPDIDFVASFWVDTSSNLLAHRGFTHSFLFCLLVMPLLAMFAQRWHKPHNISLTKWMLFFGSIIFLHVFIDSFNNYGVGWLEPFSHRRIAFNIVYVADPFFSVWPIIACILLVHTKGYLPKRRKYLRFGLGLPALYLLYCFYNKAVINADVKEVLQKQQISYTRYFTTPAPLQNWLWFIVAGSDSGYHVGFRSLFDTKKEINFRFFARNDSLLKQVDDHESLQKLIRFSKQFYTVEKFADTLLFNDLRFGQVLGWQNPKKEFVFHYYLQHAANSKLMIQRGRFVGWNWETIKTFVVRIKGN